MKAVGGIVRAGLFLVVAVVFCAPGCGNKAKEAKWEKVRVIRANMYNVAVLISTFQAESGKVFTDFSASGYGGLFSGGVRGQQLGALPVNPFTNKEMTPADFKVFRYASEDDAYNTAVGGPNDLSGPPGSIGFGFYASSDTSSPSRWAVIVFDADGRSYRAKDENGKDDIIMYHD